MSKLLLAYCIENQTVAAKIAAALHGNVEVENIVFDSKTGIQALSQVASTNFHPVILLISDNFLKSETCMQDSLFIIQSLGNQNRLLTVTTEGVSSTGQVIPTSFDKVSNVIQYMNYWQDKYLDLRKNKVENSPAFDDRVKVTRAISSEIGELLRYLRTKEYFTFDQFEDSNYVILYQALGLNVPANINVAPKVAAEVQVAAPVFSEVEVKNGVHDKPIEAIAEKIIQQSTPPIDLPKEEKAEEPRHFEKTKFQEQADALINDGLDKPSTLEALIDEIRNETKSKVETNSNISESFNQTVKNLLNEDDDKADKLIEKLSSKTEKDDDKLEITEEMLRKDPELSAIYDNNKPAVNGSHFMEELEEPKVEEHKVALEVSSIFEEATASDNTLSLENEITEGVKVTEVANKPQAELHLDNTARYNHAAQLAEQQKYAEALEQLEIIIENDRTNIDAYMLMAYVAEQSGDFLLAQNCLEKVTLLKPNYNGIFYKLGILTNQHFKNQKRKAIHYFKDALRQDPHFADAYYQLALLEIEQHGNFDDAINHLQKAIECEPHHANATFELAKAYYEIGNRKEANLFYLKAAELKPALATPINDEIFSYEEPQPEPPQLNDNGMIALVTGATSGIGRATAEILAKHGYRLILTGRRNERLSEIKESFENEFHNKIHLLNFDVRDLNSVKDAIESLDEEWKNVDILINNAGLASGLAPIHEGDIQDWELMIDTNIKGLLYMTRVIAPQMVERRKGHIVNVCSIAGKEIYPSGNVYIATKHAVDALTRAMRVDLYKHNIRVSQVAPGMVEETEFALVRFHGDAEKAKIYEDIKPLKASDVADAIYFIISRPDYVNIQDILMMSTQQGGANFYDRSGRDDR